MDTTHSGEGAVAFRRETPPRITMQDALAGLDSEELLFRMDQGGETYYINFCDPGERELTRGDVQAIREKYDFSHMTRDSYAELFCALGSMGCIPGRQALTLALAFQCRYSMIEPQFGDITHLSGLLAYYLAERDETAQMIRRLENSDAIHTLGMMITDLDFYGKMVSVLQRILE